MRKLILASMLLMPVFSFAMQLELVDGSRLPFFRQNFEEVDAFNPPIIVDGVVRRVGAIACNISSDIFFKRKHDVLILCFLLNILYDGPDINVDGLAEPTTLRKLVHKLNPVKYIKGKQIEQTAQETLPLERYMHILVSDEEGQFENQLRAMDSIVVKYYDDYMENMNGFLGTLTHSNLIVGMRGIEVAEHSQEFLMMMAPFIINEQ